MLRGVGDLVVPGTPCMSARLERFPDASHANDQAQADIMEKARDAANVVCHDNARPPGVFRGGGRVSSLNQALRAMTHGGVRPEVSLSSRRVEPEKHHLGVCEDLIAHAPRAIESDPTSAGPCWTTTW